MPRGARPGRQLEGRRSGGWSDHLASPASGDRRIPFLACGHDREQGAAKRQQWLRGLAHAPSGVDEAEPVGIYRPRPGLPFTSLTLGQRRRLVWTTFTSRQVDLNLTHPAGRAYQDRVLTTLAEGGVSMVRLNAVGYAIKTAGTSSFMTAHTLAFIDELTARARELGVQVLVEIHAHFERQIAIGAAVDRVYDFALPPLLLHSLYTGDAAPLRRWLGIRPANAVTVLDTHDGIGVIDVGPDQMGESRPGLLTPEQVNALVEGIHVHSGGQSRQATGWAASNVDVYQVNCTYYDALGRDAASFLLARAIQFFTPGIPQVYYVGLPAGGTTWICSPGPGSAGTSTATTTHVPRLTGT